MNTPNKLSLLRVALIPVLVVCMYLPGWPMILVSAAVFGAAAYTDYLDGHIARRDNIITDFGKFIDPVADKLLNLSAMIMLTHCGLLPQWAVIVILSRKLAVDGLRMVAVGQGRVIAAGKLGKIKTVSQIVLVLCMYQPGWLMILLSAAVFGAAAYTDYLDGHIARRDGLVTDVGQDGFILGRSHREAPETDGEIVFARKGRPVPEIGTFVNVKITQADTYDLMGEML